MVKNPVSLVPDFFMENIYKNTIESPVGFIEITTNLNYVLAVSFVDFRSQASGYHPEILNEATNQLDEYFKGKRKEFDLNLQPAGTDFQMQVWELVQKVHFGQTASYQDIAVLTGSKNNTRAVGLANGKNPIPIIIPCHRIIGTNGKLTGYAGGLDRKKWLLRHELNYSNKTNLLFR